MGEMWYLALVLGAFSVFIATLAWAERTWKPADSSRAEQPGD
jgi:hypothetical protein